MPTPLDGPVLGHDAPGFSLVNMSDERAPTGPSCFPRHRYLQLFVPDLCCITGEKLLNDTLAIAGVNRTVRITMEYDDRYIRYVSCDAGWDIALASTPSFMACIAL